MAEIDLVTAIGKLLSDRELRAQFARDPADAAQQFGLSAHDARSLAAVELADLERQAEGLIAKRLHEVRKLLPETMQSLGDEGAELFRYYALTIWPTGHRRHALDADGFLRFLAQNKIAQAPANERKQVKKLIHGKW